MTNKQKLLRDCKIDETEIERSVMLANKMEQEVPIFVTNTIDKIRKYLKDHSQDSIEESILFEFPLNPFCRLAYSRNYIWPEFSLDENCDLDVNVRDSVRIFDNSTSLVECISNGVRFIYFDPTNRDYDSGTDIKIRMGAISTSPLVLSCNDSLDKSKEKVNNLILPQIYSAGFKNLELLDHDDTYARYISDNPVNESRKIELISNYEGKPPLKRIKNKFVSFFYFIGSIRD